VLRSIFYTYYLISFILKQKLIFTLHFLKEMEQAVKGLSYKQMSNIITWRMSDDNIEKAMPDITNYHH